MILSYEGVGHRVLATLEDGPTTPGGIRAMIHGHLNNARRRRKVFFLLEQLDAHGLIEKDAGALILTDRGFRALRMLDGRNDVELFGSTDTLKPIPAPTRGGAAA